MSLTVNVIQFGKEQQIDLNEGTGEEILAKIPNGRNLDVRKGGEPVTKATKLADGDKLTAAPRQVKQGA